MPVLQVLQWLLLLAEIYIAGPIIYLCLLSLSAILVTRRRKVKPESTTGFSRPAFAVLVPAHDEETMLGTLLKSLSGLAYPESRYTVYVVADNCTDTTAELARTFERVQVYERFDTTRRGKGYALNWLLQKLEEDQHIYDAYVVLDADSQVEPAFLQAMERELARGARALQAHNNVLNVIASPSTALRWLALTLMNHVRPLGRNGLGVSSTLTGNGMCLSRDILTRYPWQAFSAGEDYQYYLTLVEQGERVRYVPDAVVLSHMPVTFAQMRTQDMRWESSLDQGDQQGWRIALRLLGAGLRHRDIARIEAVIELLTPPLSFMLGWCVLILTLSVLLWSPPALVIAIVLTAGLMAYVATAFYLLRPPRTVYRALLQAPRFVAWKLWVYLVLRRSKKNRGKWIRTSRSTS
ncbi:MAG TPA: glycosyltransferase family 2 protein [Ktedonobacteraceae bacterium]|nr:glycosyltransferase family 2 protein [Ktedonobacteraceae bacterium]